MSQHTARIGAMLNESNVITFVCTSGESVRHTRASVGHARVSVRHILVPAHGAYLAMLDESNVITSVGGFRVEDLGVRVYGLGVWGFEFRVWGSGFRV